MPRKIAAGNWKMNGLRADLGELTTLAGDHATTDVDIIICPPSTLIPACRNIALSIGGQDCHSQDGGAHTGDISASMLADAGASHVIVGHSERRTDHHENDSLVAAKAQAAHAAGLVAIICIGETLDQRTTGETIDVLTRQLQGSVPDVATAATTVIAYEPVWAIGTGMVPDNNQIAQAHAAIRRHLMDRFKDGADFSLLYGGSVKGSNAAEIFAVPDVNGALVGGASLKAADFSPIITALDRV